MKIKAFTLFELLIGMVISSIVIASSYFVYDLIYKQFIDYKEVRLNLVNFASLQTELENNFYHSKSIKMNDKELSFVFDNKTIYFEFLDSIIIRKDSQVLDTFRISVENFEFVENQEGLVSSIQFNSRLFDKNFDVYFNKKYCAEELINSIDRKEMND